MKRTLALISVILVLSTLFCGCKKNHNRLNYNYDMSKIVDLESLEVEVDQSEDAYKEAYSEKVSEFLVGKFTKGKVEEGDNANIDYVGKKDGVAFSGGTANGQDLLIGSGNFIPGFEDGLIGKDIGSTVELNLTFPENYGNEELKGKAVVFTVKINYITKTFTELNDENAKLCGFKSAQDIEEQAKTYAKESAAWTKVCDNAKIKYPEKETKIYFNFLLSNTKIQLQKNYGITLEQYFQYTQTSKEDLEKKIKEGENLKRFSQSYALSYYVLDETGTDLDKDALNENLELLGEEAVKSIGKEYVEATVALEQAMKIVGEKATLK